MMTSHVQVLPCQVHLLPYQEEVLQVKVQVLPCQVHVLISTGIARPGKSKARQARNNVRLVCVEVEVKVGEVQEHCQAS